mmetsp:Transcript_30646/g.99661  ORF Transcript_30646/g.99661 Transcript_30646/m.99661 type:complete len:202 (-) Transcript_30646:89-694(-)
MARGTELSAPFGREGELRGGPHRAHAPARRRGVRAGARDRGGVRVRRERTAHRPRPKLERRRVPHRLCDALALLALVRARAGRGRADVLAAVRLGDEARPLRAAVSRPEAVRSLLLVHLRKLRRVRRTRAPLPIIRLRVLGADVRLRLLLVADAEGKLGRRLEHLRAPERARRVVAARTRRAGQRLAVLVQPAVASRERRL